MIGQNHFCRSAWRRMPTSVGAGSSSSWSARTTRRMNSLRSWRPAPSLALVSFWSGSCSWVATRMNGLRTWPSRPGRLKHSSWSICSCGPRQSGTSSHHCFRPRVLGGSCGARRSVRRSCRPSWETCVRLLDPAVGFQTSGWDGEPDGGALVFGGGREFHRVWTVDREPAGARVDLKFPAGLLAFQEGGPEANAPGRIAGA